MTQTTTATDWTPGQQANHRGQVVTLGTWATRSNHTPRALGHRCQLGPDCRRFDTDRGFAWECELQPVERAEQAGPLIIRLTRTAQGYLVAAEYGATGQLIDELRAAFINYRDALKAYETGVDAFRGGMTVVKALDAIAAAKALPQLAQYAERRTARTHQIAA